MEDKAIVQRWSRTAQSVASAWRGIYCRTTYGCVCLTRTRHIRHQTDKYNILRSTD